MFDVLDAGPLQIVNHRGASDAVRMVAVQLDARRLHRGTQPTLPTSSVSELNAPRIAPVPTALHWYFMSRFNASVPAQHTKHAMGQGLGP